MSNMNSFFDELVEAKKAMETLPQVQLELDRAKGEAEVIRSRFEAECAHSAAQRELISELDATIAVKEAALSDATFRESELRTKLEMLTSLLKTVVGEANSAIDMVEPKPEPVSEPVTQQDQSDADPTNASTQTATASTNDTVSATDMSMPTGDAVGVSSDPTPDASTTGTITNLEPIAASETDLPGKFPWEAPKIGDAEDYRFQPREVPVTSSENPPSATTTPDANTANGASNINPAPTAATIEPRPYWEKPTPELWLDWRNRGGELAPWVKGLSDEQLRFAH